MTVKKGYAEVSWSGSLATGVGHAKLGSGATDDLSVTCPVSGLHPEGKSTPEELLAAAHASCFSMGLTMVLARRQHKAERIKVGVTATLEQVESGIYMITREELDVSGKVSGIDEAGFLEAVEATKAICAVGLAIKGNVEITYKVKLQS
jgi:osmotically inducible protein OsmC